MIATDLMEDRGSKVARDSHMVPTASQTHAVPSGAEGWTPSSSQAPDIRTISPQSKSMLLTETHPIRPPDGELEERKPKQGVAEKRNKVKRVKRYKKDEIDDIFGQFFAAFVKAKRIEVGTLGVAQKNIDDAGLSR
ncbi:hypothetical protein JB92DRAFT_2832842 [Gautieria morchelliformis]|nr:hypothetical protein JB92DRAFT_2832842 [Gautieria morchelliformis]